MTAPPLTGIRVIEFAGLAPGPFCGKLLADYGASVLRIDRHDLPPHPTLDPLASHKRSLAVNLRSPSGVTLVQKLLQNADVLIDPFRPGILEKLGLGPDAVCAKNNKIVYTRLTGFRCDGKYAAMAGHDINYLAVSGVLSLLGREGEPPIPPANILGDFAAGGVFAFLGILLALLSRHGSGRGQVVEANIVDGSAYLTAYPRFLLKTPVWDRPRGQNLLDGGAPFYATYRTKDGGYVAVGALEPQFYAVLVKLLFIDSGADIPDRNDKRNWPALRDRFEKRFLEKTRREWEIVFEGTDACVTPVLTHSELEESGFEQRPAVTLTASTVVKGNSSEGWTGKALKPGEGGREALGEWWGWEEGVEWRVGEMGFESIGQKVLAKL